MSAKRDLDLANFDTETSQLYLVVQPSQILKIAVGEPATRISRSIQSGPWLFREWIEDEFFRRQFGQIQVTSSKTITTNVQLASHTNWHRLQHRIEHIDLRVCQWATDGNGAVCRSGTFDQLHC